MFAGARTPFVLRRAGDEGSALRKRIVGEAYMFYVHSVMYGEALEQADLEFRVVEIE